MEMLSSSTGSTEWRACASDDGDRLADVSEWHDTRADAEIAGAVMTHAEPPFDRVWIEKRECGAPQQVTPPTEYDIALRPDSSGALDDVVVNDVKMFRAEALGDDVWWLCCYLRDGERITWHVGVDDNRSRSARSRNPVGIAMSLVEIPSGDFVYEEGSMDESPHV